LRVLVVSPALCDAESSILTESSAPPPQQRAPPSRLLPVPQRRVHYPLVITGGPARVRWMIAPTGRRFCAAKSTPGSVGD